MEQFKLYSYLDSIKDVWKFNLDSLPERIRLQKLVYLMQAMGLKLNYNYNLYIRGPYSPDLTRDAFELNGFSQEVGNYILHHNPIDEEDSKKLQKFRLLVEGFDDPLSLEIMATLHYLVKETYIPNKDESKIFSILLEKKPYAEDSYMKCWKRLKDFHLV